MPVQSSSELQLACLLSQAQDRQLAGVKLSKKDARELRDLMPTDENLLETCRFPFHPSQPVSHLSLPASEQSSLHISLLVNQVEHANATLWCFHNRPGMHALSWHL